MKHSKIITIQRIIVLLFFLCTTHSISSQSNNSLESFRIKSKIDSLKVDLSIFYRRDVSSHKYYSNLSSQDSINYKMPSDTILRRVRIFKLTINQKTSIGDYKNSIIKNVRLEYKYKDKIVHVENEKLNRPKQNITLWKGKSNSKPERVNKIDQVLIILTSENRNKLKNSKYIVNF